MSLLSLGADMNISEKILVVFCAGIGVPFLGFVCGRFFSAWFPFRLTKKFYLPIKSARLQKFLISGETFHWGRAQPKGIPEKYYRVSPENRGKMCIWGILFYFDWYLLFIFCVLVWFGRLSADSVFHFASVIPFGKPGFLNRRTQGNESGKSAICTGKRHFNCHSRSAIPDTVPDWALFHHSFPLTFSQ